jgi:ribulose-5-phosphate 4-epimerase/fuculose-1-phosphate aldolase
VEGTLAPERPTAGPDRDDGSKGALVAWFTDGLRATMLAQGLHLVEEGSAAERAGESGVVLHPFDSAAPRSYRRRSRAVFVVGVGEAEAAPEEPLKTGYPLLLYSLANLFILVARTGKRGSPEAYFFTLEQGSYAIPWEGDDDAFFAAVVRRIAPLATSRLVIDNVFHPDLPEELWQGDEHTAAIERAGKHLDELDLLPAPFPLEDFLSPKDFRHVQQLFGIGGLSYGNLSQRRDETSFWMSASGVDKSRLRTVGQDILLVTGFDPEAWAIQLSVPPNVKPRRVSVDAIEHFMIYREHPSVGAILHVHAWMEDIPSTEVNYPCGTLQLAEAVAELVRRELDPAHAVIGLKNHGLTITGESLDEIFARTENRILRQVPMS